MRKYLLTVLAAATMWVATSPAIGAPADHDCATFYMGAGNFPFPIFNGALDQRFRQFRAANPRSQAAMIHYWQGRTLRGCKNPLYVGHSMGALSAIAQANADRKGRVVSIDPPSWPAGSERDPGCSPAGVCNPGGTRGTYSARPTRHLYQCGLGFGCGKVYGPSVRKNDLTFRRLGHVPLPSAPEVGQAILQ